MILTNKNPPICTTCKSFVPGFRCSNPKVRTKFVSYLTGETQDANCWAERSKDAWNAPCGMKGRLWRAA